MEIIAYNHDIPLSTPIYLKVTLKELLNICASVDSTSPSSVKEYMIRMYDMTEEKAADVMIKEIGVGERIEYSNHKLSTDIHNILKKYGILDNCEMPKRKDATP